MLFLSCLVLVCHQCFAGVLVVNRLTVGPAECVMVSLDAASCVFIGMEQVDELCAASVR